MGSFFEDLGRKIGRAAVPAYRKSKWVWDGLTGSEEEALEAERELGKVMAAELRLVTGVIEDAAMQDWIGKICHRLQEASGKEGMEFRVELIEADHPSAIGLPGGYFFVSRSLIEFCDGDPDETAFVIGHEAAHVIRRHTWDRMIQQAALKAASVVTRRAGVLAGWLRQQGLPMLRSAHSKDCEFEADRDAFGLVLAAKFDPNGAIRFLRKIDDLETDPEIIGEYFASHPDPVERLESLRSHFDQ